MKVVALVLVLLAAFVCADKLHVGSFNIQVFGTKKIQNTEVLDVLVKTLKRYHIALIQEIRDNTDTAMLTLLEKLNKSGKVQYKVVESSRLGRTNSKERYAFIYDPSKVTVVTTYEYPDTDGWFERAPYSVLFQSKADPKKKIFLSGVHIQPDAAVAEIDHLVDVYEFYAKKKELATIIKSNWMIMGDFNAGGRYVSKRAMKTIRLRTENDSRFTWLIKDGTRTTVAANNNAYDRFVVTSGLTKCVGSVFRFDEAFGLSTETTELVSDHFPIETYIEI
jgi:endonuclease/exonuclease/phosphatase family metal-dependent hydrolase